MGKTFFITSLIVVLAFLLRSFHLSQTIVFGGDEGWGYLAGLQVIRSYSVFLDGPPTSLGWLKLGPFTYYLIALSLKIGQFHPLSFSYVTVELDSLAVITVFYAVYALSSKKAGWLAGLLYAVSPFLIERMRTPLYVHLAPFFSALVLLFWFRYLKYRKISNLYFGVISFALLVQVHITPLLMLPGLAFSLWHKLSAKKALRVILFFLLPLTPFLIQQAQNGFSMLLRLTAWIPYRAASAFGIITNKNILTVNKIIHTVVVLSDVLAGSFFLWIPILAFIFFAVGLASFVKAKRLIIYRSGVVLILGISLVGLFLHGQITHHYLMYLLPLIIVVAVIGWGELKKFYLYSVLTLLVAVQLIWNLNQSYKPGFTLTEKQKIVEFIINDSGGSYSIVPSADIVDLPHFYDGYKYLGFYMGVESDQASVNRYMIIENNRDEPWVTNFSNQTKFDHATVVKIPSKS